MKFNTKPKTDPLPPPAPIAPREITADELPSEDFMVSLDIPPTQFGDFMKAFRFVLYQAQGMTITKASRAVGISRSLLYKEYWANHIAKAQRAYLGVASAGVKGAHNQVLEEWPDLLNGLLLGIRDPNSDLGDKVKAMEFLYMTVISQQEEERTDDSLERKYLQQGNVFNPMMAVQAIQAQAGSTIIINNPLPPVETPLSIEAEIVDESD